MKPLAQTEHVSQDAATPQKISVARELLRIPVVVAALGYLVDMYDLFLFSIVRIPSLTAIGVSGSSLLDDGVFLLNMQMAGLLIGGVFWGVLGDKRGRLSVLFGSILIYSLANIANGFVQTVPQYAALRFIAGIGLAGELGAGITLVSEILPRQIRGYGTTLVATLGVFGAILAYFIADIFEWRAAYFIGGGLGLVLLVMRVRVFESGMFLKSKTDNVQRGNFLMLFNHRERFFRYLKCILVGLPIWFVSGIMITFSPELGAAIGVDTPVDAGIAVILAFASQTFGNISSGVLSQYTRSRKKIMAAFIVMCFIFSVLYLALPITSLNVFYAMCLLLGFTNGYWALFVTVSAELFGTNLRATVATTVPNFVRGAIIPITMLFLMLRDSIGILNSALIIAFLTTGVALLALWKLTETFDKDLDYNEE
jgi:MFS family permease